MRLTGSEPVSHTRAPPPSAVASSRPRGATLPERCHCPAPLHRRFGGRPTALLPPLRRTVTRCISVSQQQGYPGKDWYPQQWCPKQAYPISHGYLFVMVSRCCVAGQTMEQARVDREEEVDYDEQVLIYLRVGVK